MTAAVECTDLTHRFGTKAVVDRLTLTIDRGEVFGMLGPNGAGKTTTIRLINTLVPVQQGSIRVFGFNVGTQAMDVRYNLGFVPQQLSIEAALTRPEERNVVPATARRAAAQRRARTDDALAAMNLLGVADGLAGTYEGVIRRLELAQAQVNRPALLVLDEPTVGLDLIARDGVWERVRAMRAEFGMTVSLTTHYMEEAEELLRSGRALAPRIPTRRRRPDRVEEVHSATPQPSRTSHPILIRRRATATVAAGDKNKGSPVMRGAVDSLVHRQARSGGSAQATRNPSRSTFGSGFTRPPMLSCGLVTVARSAVVSSSLPDVWAARRARILGLSNRSV